MPLLFLEAADVESNPGPTHEHTLSVLHLNIRSITKSVIYKTILWILKSYVFQKRIQT